MANDLTGDFDVVAQFTVPAANRVLAAMHRGGRVPHSWTLRVDDYNHIHISPGTVATETGVRSITDAFGGAVTDPGKAVNVSYKPTSEAAIHSDFVVNQPKPAPKHDFGGSAQEISSDPNRLHIPTPAELERASHLNGVAQVQLGAPTISFGRTHTSIVVHTPVMARYTPDEGTFDIPNFLHGEFQTTIEVQQASSSAGNLINIKLASPDGRASFAPTWVSPTWDSEPAQLAVINKALVNSLKNSFEPSSTKVPSSIPIMNFKTMQDDSQAALTVMMDIPGGVLAGEVLAAALFGIGTGVPDPSTVTNIFLGQGDDFAMAVRSDDIISAFFAAVNDAVPRRQDFTTTTSAEGPYGIGSYTFHTFTTITTDDPVVELLAGQILVSIQVHVHFSNDSSYVPSPNDFDFPIKQAFNLVLNGGQVTLQPLGDLVVDVPPSVGGSLKDFVTKNAKTQFTNAWNSASGSVQTKVGSSLSANNLQGFLQSMMNPVPGPGSQPVEQVNPKLSYTWYEINPSGIVLHGTLEMPAWSKPHVEFTFQTVAGVMRLAPARSEYNALKSWIPGGTLQEFIWTQDGAPLDDDRHRFVFSRGSHAPLSRVCLTVKGSRITASGPITYQTVTAKSLFCGWQLTMNARNLAGLAIGAERPTVALTRKSTAGGMEVIGHISPWAADDTAREDATNLILHFPDSHSLDRIELLPRVLQRKENQETAAAIIVVVSPEQLSKIKPVDGVVFSDDEKRWARALPLQQRPATFVIDTEGDVIWQHQGPLSGDELAANLSRHLPQGGGFDSRVLGPALRVGHPVPNFLFDYSPGNELTLRKLYGRPVVLVFWRSTSAASLEAICDLECAFKSSGNHGPVLLAINDGESAEVVRHAAKGIKAIVVPDPARDISAACGINVWPTSIYLDKAGLVTDICYGRFCGQTEKAPANTTGEEYTCK